MTSKDKLSEQAAELRRRAEEIDRREAALAPYPLENLSPEEIRQTLHGLRVHRIELEMQNEELRRTQMELDATRARYFDLYDLAPVGYCTVSEKGLIQEANLTAATLLGVARSVLAGKPITLFILKEDQDIYYLHRKQLVETGSPTVVELRMVKKDGATFWVRLNVAPSHDSAGKPACRIVLTDISEYKQEEEALRESEARFRKLFEGHSAIKLILDTATGDIIDANQAAAKFYGWSVEKLRQMRIQDINILPFEAVKTEMGKISLSEGSSFEFRHRRADGSIRDVEVFSNKIEIGEKFFLYSIIHDITERKWADDILQASESRFRTIVQDIPSIAVQGYGPDGTTQYWNKASERLYGYSAREAIGRNLLDLIIPPEMRAEVRQSIRQMTETGQTIPASELTLMRKDGTRIAVFSSHAIFQIPGRKQELFCIDIDLTEYKRAQEVLVWQTAELVETNIKLENEKRLLAAVMEALPTGVAITDARGGSLQTNSAYERIWGGPRPEALSVEDYNAFKAWWDDTGKPVAPEEWASAIAVKEGEAAVGQMMRIQRFNGSEAFVINSAAPVYDARGGIVGSAVAIQDITELKQTEKILDKSREEMQIILDASPIMIFYKDCENRFIRVNKRLAEVTGLPKEAMEGKTISEIYPNQATDYWKDDREVIASGMPKNGIIEPIDTTAGIRCVQTDKIPYRDKDGRIIGIIGFSVDITERKQAEEQLQSINSELERRVEQRTRELQEAQMHYLHAEKLAAIGKLSASIAHEFNNPLQGIMSILKGLKKRAILEEEDRELLNAAVGESERMKNLIRNLQDFNRPSSGKKVVMDVHKSIDSVLLLHKSDFKTKRISVVLNYAERLPQIQAIPDQIKQVFLNLLTNAADACQLPDGMITISTWQEDQKIAVAIKDTGIGIEPEKMNMIFQPFFTTKPAVKGTGLGLSVCHGIIKNHQGEIRVESVPGKGATFTVLLPIKGS
jgi:PAS domain S-box-containing protein